MKGACEWHRESNQPDGQGAGGQCCHARMDCYNARKGGAGMKPGSEAGPVLRGRPRIQETADHAVASLLASAGADVDRPAWSTRALAERTGLSQTIVSRAIRRLAEGRIAGAAGAGSAGAGSSGAAGAGSAGAGAHSDAGAGGNSGGDERNRGELVLVHVDVDGFSCQTVFEGAPAEVKAAGPRVHLRRRAVFFAALGVLGVEIPEGLHSDLAAAAEVPIGVLGALAAAVAEEGPGRRVAWSALPSVPSGRTDHPEAPHSDSLHELAVWLPRAGVSVTEMLAVRLRDAIIASDLRPGDPLTPEYCARLLGVPRSVAAEVLRRMVDDELLDGSRGDVRIPLASADDVIELYAARMLLGDVLLRAAAARPRRYLLQARRVLDAIADGVAAGVSVGDADLRFQQEVARASGLEQTVRLFESSTVRIRMLIAVLRMDYARTAHSILAGDRQILAALIAGDADRAVRAWHRKTDEAVRHMHGRARHAAFDVDLWRRLTAL